MDNVMIEFQAFGQKILDIFKSSNSGTEKWTKIATFTHEKNTTVIKTFATIKKMNMRKEIKLDYSLKINQLENQISQESDELVKCSLIILLLHQIIYNLLTTEGNYYFFLNGQEQMKVLGDKNIMYYINMSIKNEQNVYFHAFFLLYALESLFNEHFYVGMDFEFTTRKIQLAQLNFEHNVTPIGIIMMVSPSELELVVMENFIYLIMCNKLIKKILHGSDSLDIPYLYSEMLGADPKKIIKFTKTLVDTRFLCEYYKLSRDETSDYRCRIYDEDSSKSAIYYFGVISEEQQNKLSEMLQSMPPPADITWNIHKMPKSQVLYAQYDVIFLKYFFYRMIYVATEDEKTDIEKKNVIVLYKSVLTELTQFVYLENNNITFLTAKCKEEVDVVNNYFIKKSTGIVKMKDIYDQVSKNLSVVDPKVDIDKLIRVNHFKKKILFIIKRIVYGFISQKCRVQKDKSTVWMDKFENKFILNFFEEMKFHCLYNIFKNLGVILEPRVKMICTE